MQCRTHSILKVVSGSLLATTVVCNVLRHASIHAQSSAYLIVAVGSPLREEGLHVGVTQQVILGHPVRQQNVVTKIQVATVDPHQLQVLLCQLPHSLGRGYGR